MKHSPHNSAVTLVEILVVLAIVAVVAAVTYPVFAHSRESGHRSSCVQRLRQLHLAISVYRLAENGADEGFPWEMGFPGESALDSVYREVGARCAGVSASEQKPGDIVFFGSFGEAPQIWKSLVGQHGQCTVLIGDPNHNPGATLANPNFQKVGIGVRLDGSVFQLNRYGDITNPNWWYQGEKK